MQKTAYVMRIRDWSSDVCSSDLGALGFSLLLSACNATAPLDIPEVGEAPTLSNVSIDFAPEATFALTKIVADIKRGEVIGAFPSHGIETEGYLCHPTSRGDAVITWESGSESCRERGG